MCVRSCTGSLFCGVVIDVPSIFAIILLRKRESWLLCFNCVVAVCSVTLLHVILAFPVHTHLLFKPDDVKKRSFTVLFLY